MIGTCIAQARASLEITWQIVHINWKHRFDSNQSQGFVMFSQHPVGVLFDSWFVSKFVSSPRKFIRSNFLSPNRI